MNKALTIAGSDSSGGAGIQADLKTFMAFGVFGTSAITALTAQNTLGVQDVFAVSPEFVRTQIKSILSDIGTDAAKTGMLANPEIVLAVAESVKEFKIPNLVVDPVMIAKGGDPLLSAEARETIKKALFPLATVITPNIFEAEVLLQTKINSIEKMKNAAADLFQTGCQWVVIKGGHLPADKPAIDIIFNGRDFHQVESPRFDTKNTHGTGCTFSSAIAAGLAKGRSPLAAIQQAKIYISEAIRTSFAIGEGHGPTNHSVGLKSPW